MDFKTFMNLENWAEKEVIIFKNINDEQMEKILEKIIRNENKILGMCFCNCPDIKDNKYLLDNMKYLETYNICSPYLNITFIEDFLLS